MHQDQQSVNRHCKSGASSLNAPVTASRWPRVSIFVTDRRCIMHYGMSSNFPLDARWAPENRGEQTIGHRENEQVRPFDRLHVSTPCREEPIRMVFGSLTIRFRSTVIDSHIPRLWNVNEPDE